MARKWSVADCETTQFQTGRMPEPIAWGWTDGDTFRSWTGRTASDDFVAFLRTLPDSIVYAHNGGGFDWLLLGNWLTEADPILAIDGRIIRARIGNVELRDSFLLLPVALSEHRKEEFDYSVLEWHCWEAHRDAIVSYLRSDCESLHELLSEWFAANPRTMTLSQAGIASLRKSLAETGIRMPKASPAFDARFRQWYFGGRVQALAPGVHGGPLYLFDQRSAYPYAMATTEHPLTTIYHQTSKPKDSQLTRSFLKIRARSLGVLPRRLSNGSVRWDEDGESRHYVATGHEVVAGMESGGLVVEEIEDAFVWLDCGTFAEWVHEHWQARRLAERNGRRAEALVRKLLLNGTYGKLGQRARDRRVYELHKFRPTDELARDAEVDTSARYEGRVGRWFLWSRLDDSNLFTRASLHNVATAASIAGAQRASMYRALMTSSGAVYLNTDGIVCRSLTPSEGLGDEIGQWTREGPYRRAGIVSGRAYGLQGGPNVTDRVEPHVLGLSADDMLRAAAGKSVRFDALAPTLRLGQTRWDHRTFTVGKSPPSRFSGKRRDHT